ncbi:MAG: hypothetical protein JKY09_08110 [Crocinitomicaceae bacterium]|nr:hypothetical protein [Crocinitomicaceae bacterium]
MKYLIFPLITFFLFSCNYTPESDGQVLEVDKDTTVQETLEEQFIRHIESQLKMPATEKYTYKIYKENMNPDDSIDWILTVNLRERAINKAATSTQTAKRAEIGYMGNFNFFFFMDGKTKKMSPAIVVPSSPLAALAISFENITSESYKDFLCDLRITNSKIRRFYTVYNGAPLQVCESVIFDGVTSENNESYVIKYEPGSYSLAKNILVYKGKMEPIELTHSDDIYTIEPEITATDELAFKWYYHPRQMKYFMKKDEL